MTFALPELPAELEIQRPVVSTSDTAMKNIAKLINKTTSEGVNLVTISGLCGGCKSTLSRNLETQASDQLIPISLNGTPRKVLSLDWIMSVSRGPQKIALLEKATPESIRADFFRTQALADLIIAIRQREAFNLINAYDAEDQGQLTGRLQLAPVTDRNLLIAEGTVAHAAAELALANTPEEVEGRSVSAINMLVYTDPAVALLNTVKRGVMEPSRKKDPHYAFREFLSFNSLLLPGYLNLDQHNADLVYRPDDINPQMFNALVEFFAIPGYEALPTQFIEIIKAEFQTQDSILKAQNQHIIAVLETINRAIKDQA